MACLAKVEIDGCRGELDNGIEIIVIFVVGGPGAGKGTQCKRISEEYSNVVTLSTGELLRNFCKCGTTEAKKISKQMSDGKLVDINATEKLLKPEFIKYTKKNNKSNIKNIFVIDGFPRDMNILLDFENAMKNDAFDTFVPFIIEFACDDNTMKKRLLNRQKNEKIKRHDNNNKAIQNRIDLFYNETQQVIDYFKSLNKYKCIDASQNVDQVFKSFCNIINPIRQYATINSINSIDSINASYDCNDVIGYNNNHVYVIHSNIDSMNYIDEVDPTDTTNTTDISDQEDVSMNFYGSLQKLNIADTNNTSDTSDINDINDINDSNTENQIMFVIL